MNPRHKLELGVDRALDGVYLAQEGLAELADKPFGVGKHLEAALRELRDALGLIPPGADGLVQPVSRDQISVPMALPGNSDEVREVFPAREVRGRIKPAGGEWIDVVRDPDGRIRRDPEPPSVPHPFVPAPEDQR